MNDHKQLFRQWLILRRLASSRQGCTVEDLAREFSVSQRTIRRDLKAFRDLGFPLQSRTGPAGKQHWSLAAEERLASLSFNTDEAIALALLRPSLEGLRGSFIYDAAQEAFQKIDASLSQCAREYMQRIFSLLYAPPIRRTDYSSRAEVIELLWRGLEESLVVQMQYHSLRQARPRQYAVHPYAVVFHRGALYVVAYSEHHQELRHFKVDRIVSLELTSRRFRRDPNFDVTRHFAHSFGMIRGQGKVQQVVIRFSRHVARYVQESQWHPSQQNRVRRDGSLEVSFRLDCTEELKRWVLGFGPHAQVLRPPAFRREVQQELQQALANYA